MYFYIAIAAYIVILFLSLRDIRIYRRTGYLSYRKGAIKGIIASSIALIGAILTINWPEAGLLIVFLGLYFNSKGVRETVFANATTLERLTGRTDIEKDNN